MSISIVIAFVLGVVLGSVITAVLKTKGNGSKSFEGSEGTDIPSKTLYVGNLPYRTNEAAIREHFSQYGQVISVRLMKDRHTGRRKGYGFVEIAENDAEKVIEKLNNTDFQERTLKVREANERSQHND